MRHLFFLVLGIGLGVGGEWLIPRSLTMPVGNGCFESRGYVYLPALQIRNLSQDSYPHPYAGSGFRVVPSYRYALARMIGEITEPDQSVCNAFSTGDRK
jgi:hypothetical protein